MNLSIPALLMLACLVSASACRPAPVQYTELETRVVDALDQQSILIQVDHGEVLILGSEDSRVRVEGQVLSGDELEYQVSATEKRILIKVFSHGGGSSDLPLRVNLHIPKHMQAKVETDSASVFVKEYQGDVEVASTSGHIRVEGMTGKVTLQSNRGNITVRETSGLISMVGNYGRLNVQNVHGQTAASTIMGNVVFDGVIETGDTVNIETDHGSVSVNLGQESAVSLQVRSTSGEVTCLFPDTSSSTRSCEGQFGVGDGALNIRTVSGAVTLQLTP